MRQHGFGQHYAGLNHPLNRARFALIALDGGRGEAPANTRAAFDQALAAAPTIWLHTGVRQCLDGLVAFHAGTLETTTNGQGLVENHTFAQLQKLDAGNKFDLYRGRGLRLLSLDQLLELYPQTSFVFDIHSNLVDIHKRVIEVIDRHHADSRVLIQSDHDVIISAIKELKPMWLFGTGTRDLTRSHFLASLYLEPLAPLLGDIFLTAARWHGHEVVQANLIHEVHRREKKFFVEGVSDPKQLAHFRQLGVDGVLTETPRALAQALAAAQP